MSKMNELIARLENATAGSRELDAAICWIAKPYPQVAGKPEWRQLPHGPQQHVPTVAPRYTTSLDAALALIPENWTRGLLTWPGYDNGTLKSKTKAELHSVFSSGGGPREIGYAETLPLAICIAALKVRSR